MPSKYTEAFYAKHKERLKKASTKSYHKNKSKYKAKRDTKKLDLIIEKGGACEICGYTSEIVAVFDFHHLDPKVKGKGVAQLLSGPMDNCGKELEKCILLCANCHRELHHLADEES